MSVVVEPGAAAGAVAGAVAGPVLDIVTGPILDWYAQHARDLPWREPDATPWSIVVSEFMLQQTPVARVLEPWRRWIERWPTAGALAAAAPGEAIRAWGRLGYPRRALRLHATATAIVEHHHGEVPTDVETLRGLPGIGSYTAAAIASFAFGQRHVVLDTNARRLLARLWAGQPLPPAAVTAAERARAAAFVPKNPDRAARWAVASMELGALVCTARTPRCGDCPVRQSCRWEAAGRPVPEGPARRRQSYVGTDRQCRGALLAVLRGSDQPVAITDLVEVWPPDAQHSRCLRSLIADGLAEPVGAGHVALPDDKLVPSGPKENGQRKHRRQP